MNIKIRTVLGGVKCNTKEGLFGIAVCTEIVGGRGQTSVKREGGVFATFAEVKLFQ